MRKDEYILCAAIWFDDGVDRELPEIKGKTGFVITGRRHSNCYHIAHVLTGGLRKDLPQKDEEGFLTNKTRFVGRHEAAEIAFVARQINERTTHPRGLYSEDLY